MKNLAAFLVLAVTNLSALNVGERYDFICTDGQDIYNAELVVEDAERYFVKLSPVMSRVPIEKKYVLKTVPRSMAAVPPPLQFKRVLSLAGGIGADVATGKLSSFATYAPGIFLSASYLVFPRFHATVRADAEQFTSGSSYLRALNFYAGAEYELPWAFSRFSFFAGAAGGASWLNASSSTFGESAGVPSAMVWVRVSCAISERLGVFLAPGGRYVYDRDTLLIMPGVSFGLSYKLFGT